MVHDKGISYSSAFMTSRIAVGCASSCSGVVVQRLERAGARRPLHDEARAKQPTASAVNDNL